MCHVQSTLHIYRTYIVETFNVVKEFLKKTIVMKKKKGILVVSGAVGEFG